MKRNKAQTKGRNKELWKFYILAGTLIVSILAIAAYLLYQKIYYGNRWYQGTVVNDVDLSGQTLEESKRTITAMHENYILHITGRDQGSLSVAGEDIRYEFGISSEFDALFDKQHENLQMIPKKHEYQDVEYTVSYEKDRLKKILQDSVLVKGSDAYQIVRPVSAHVQFSEENQRYELIEEVRGNKIVLDNLLEAVDQILCQAKTEMDLTDETTYPGIYKAPQVVSTDEALQKELAACNYAALRYIVWNMGEGVTEQITPVELSQWIRYRNGVVRIDQDAVQKWVESFCLKYKTVGRNRKIISHTGKTVEIRGGDYGWQLNYEETLKQAKKAVKAEIDHAAIDAYLDNPSEENRKALTLKRKVQYANTAFQKDFRKEGQSAEEYFPMDWDTGNYTEVCLKHQKVYVFRNGKVKFSCRCITGRPVEGRTTPLGAFYVKEHKREYTLTGEDYKTPVKNWVRVTWSGTGFHPATWQPWSRWTKDLYKTKGSHGCINLSVEDAATIYDMVPYREAVFIH